MLIVIYDLKKMGGHDVRLQLVFWQTWVNFRWPLSDNLLLFTLLEKLSEPDIEATLFKDRQGSCTLLRF